MALRLRRPVLLLGLACICLRATLASRVVAHGGKALPVTVALRVHQLGSLMPIVLSPDGKWLAYTLQDNSRIRSSDWESYVRTGVPPWAVGTDIALVNTETGESKNVTGGKGDNWLPSWSPNGRYLAFLSDRDGGESRLWVWDALTDTLRKVSNSSLRTSEIQWSANSQHLLVTALPDGFTPAEFLAKVSVGAEPRNRRNRDVDGSRVVLYGFPARLGGAMYPPQPGSWNLERYLADLVSIGIDGKIRTIVRSQRIASFSLSPNGSRIAYTIPRRFERPGSQQVLFDLAAVDRSTNRERILASGIRLAPNGESFSWSPNGRRLAFLTGGMEEKNPDCYLVDLARGIVRNLSTPSSTRTTPVDESAKPLWGAAGREIYFIRDGALWHAKADQLEATEIARIPGREIFRLIPKGQSLLWTIPRPLSTVVVTHDNENKQDGFYSVDLDDGKNDRLMEKGQCYTCGGSETQFAVTSYGRRLAYVAEDAQHDADIWISDAGFKNPRQLTHLNPNFENYKMGAVKLVHWLNDDGVRSTGTLLLPASYKVGTQYPLIVWVYGGSLQSNDLDHFGLVGTGPFNMQLLATRGYAVFLPDTTLHVGTPMLDLAKTVLPGVNKVIELGIADPNRIGIIGHSFGGFSALALIVQTNRFAAAIDMSGFGDLIGNYGAMTKGGTAFGQAVEEQGQGAMGGTLWQFRDRYFENSPVFYLDRVRTPLLIVHGADDSTVASFLGDEIFVDLRRLAKEVEYAKYQDEGHSPLEWSYADQRDLCNRMIAWLTEYVKEKAHN